MAATSNNAGTRRRTTRPKTTQKRTAQSTQTTNGKATETAYTRARQAAETVLDVPVGTALVVVDRFGEVVRPYTSRETAERELRSLRTQIRRELNKAERRGGTARRKVNQRAKRSRTQAERELKQRRRRVEQQLRRTRTQVRQRVSTLV